MRNEIQEPRQRLCVGEEGGLEKGLNRGRNGYLQGEDQFVEVPSRGLRRLVATSAAIAVVVPRTAKRRRRRRACHAVATGVVDVVGDGDADVDVVVSGIAGRGVRVRLEAAGKTVSDTVDAPPRDPAAARTHW